MATKQLENKKPTKTSREDEADRVNKSNQNDLVERLQPKNKKNEKRNLNVGLFLGIVAVFWMILTLTTIGKNGTILYACITICFSLASFYLCGPIFLKARSEREKEKEKEEENKEDNKKEETKEETEKQPEKEEVKAKTEEKTAEEIEAEKKNKKQKYTKSMLVMALAGIALIGSVASMIASPLVRNAEQLGQGEQKTEAARPTLEQERDKIFSQLAGKVFNIENQNFCQSFTGNDYPNNYQKSIRFDDNSHVTVYGCGDSIKTYSIEFGEDDAYKFNFNSYNSVEISEDLSYLVFKDNKYVTTVPMQNSVVSELEKSKSSSSTSTQTTANTTLTGKDHDENDQAGKYTALMNKCLDRLNHHFENTYPLDSDDGYPISYSVTLDSNGTLVEGTMAGHHKTKTTQKILEYKCVYKNGSAKIQGLD